jgi:hypothetical protein
MSKFKIIYLTTIKYSVCKYVGNTICFGENCDVAAGKGLNIAELYHGPTLAFKEWSIGLFDGSIVSSLLQLFPA